MVLIDEKYPIAAVTLNLPGIEILTLALNILLLKQKTGIF